MSGCFGFRAAGRNNIINISYSSVLGLECHRAKNVCPPRDTIGLLIQQHPGNFLGNCTHRQCGGYAYFISKVPTPQTNEDFVSLPWLTSFSAHYRKPLTLTLVTIPLLIIISGESFSGLSLFFDINISKNVKCVVSLRGGDSVELLD